MICSNRECGIEFEPRTHNQKYCTDECCRVATNKRIMEKYYEKKAIKGGLARSCAKCSIKLSRYNDTNLCSVCQKTISKTKKDRTSLLRMINEIS